MLPIVHDQDVRNAESADDFFPKEVLDPSLNDGRDGFYLNPLCEVFYGHDQEFLMGCGDWEWSQNVHSPYSKGPWTSNWMLNVGGLLSESTKLLTLGALLDELKGIF